MPEQVTARPDQTQCAVCLLNPADSVVMERTNELAATSNHSTKRGIRNTDNFDRYLDHMTLRNERFSNAVENLAMLQNAVETDSAGNENEADQQTSDTAKKAIEQVSVDMATNLGNIAVAMAPALVQSGQPLTILGLAMALPAMIQAGQAAVAKAQTPTA